MDRLSDKTDRFTERMLSRLDGPVKKKFGVSLAAILDDPSAYMDQENFAVKLSKITDYVDKETELMLNRAKGSSRSFHVNAEKADNLTRKLGSYISAYARQKNIPLVKPASVELSLRGKNRFYLNELDDSATRFVEKLMGSSSFIVDMTKNYDDQRIGMWLFGGEREYIVGVHAPKNSMLLVRSGRAEILDRLREASDYVKGL